MENIAEWHDVDARQFHNDILPLNKPAVLRGVVASWPAVAQGAQSPQALGHYLNSCDIGKTAETFLAAASIKGRF